MRAAAYWVALLAWPELSSLAHAQKPLGDRGLPPGAIRRLGSEALRHPNVQATAYSPDGTVLITGGKGLRVWDARTRRLLRTIPLDDGEDGKYLHRLQFTPNGKTLFAYISSREGMSVAALDFATGKQLWRYRPKAPHYLWGISPDGRTLVTASPTTENLAPEEHKNELTLWDLATKKRLRTLPGHKRTADIPPQFKTYLVIDSVAFSPDGKWLASMSSHHDVAVRVYEVATGKEKYALRRLPRLTPPLFFTAAGHLAVVSSTQPPGAGDKGVTLWDLKTGKIHRELSARAFWFLGISPDGKGVAGLGPNMEVCVWEFGSGQARFPGPHRETSFRTLEFSPDGTTLVGCGGYLEMYDLVKSRDVLGPEGHTAIIRALDVSADGRTVVTGGAEGAVRIWDARTGKVRQRLDSNGNGGYAVALSPDGRTLATTGYRNDVVLWNVASGIAVWRVSLRNNDYTFGSCVAFSPDGKTLAVAASNGTYRFFEAATGQERPLAAPVRAHLQWFSWPGSIGAATQHAPFRFSPDGKLFAGLRAEGNGAFAVALWDMTANAPRVIGPSSKALGDLAFSPDGEYLAWSDAGVAHVWDVRASRKLKTLPKGPADDCLAFTPDGRYLIHGKRLHPLDGKRAARELPVRPGRLAFSRDGRTWVVVPRGECTALVMDPGKLGK
jgi:WD40 repeat protein